MDFNRLRDVIELFANRGDQIVEYDNPCESPVFVNDWNASHVLLANDARDLDSLCIFADRDRIFSHHLLSRDRRNIVMLGDGECDITVRNDADRLVVFCDDYCPDVFGFQFFYDIPKVLSRDAVTTSSGPRSRTGMVLER